jgi:hypothetical protein
LMAIKADARPWPLIAIAAWQWLSSPPRSIKTDPRAPAVAPSLSRAPHLPPRPLMHRRHRGPPPAAATLHHQPSSRTSPSNVKTSKCSPIISSSFSPIYLSSSMPRSPVIWPTQAPPPVAPLQNLTISFRLLHW